MNLAALTAAHHGGPGLTRRSVEALDRVGHRGVGLRLRAGSGPGGVAGAATPPLLITTVAGLAMLGALVTAVAASLEDPGESRRGDHHFLVVASGIVIVGIGSPFWGLVVGGIVMLWLGWHRRRRERRAALAAAPE